VENIKTKSRKSSKNVRVKQQHIPDIILSGQHRNIRRKAVSPSGICSSYTVKNLSQERAYFKHNIKRDEYLSDRNLIRDVEQYYDIFRIAKKIIPGIDEDIYFDGVNYKKVFKLIDKKLETFFKNLKQDYIIEKDEYTGHNYMINTHKMYPVDWNFYVLPISFLKNIKEANHELYIIAITVLSAIVWQNGIECWYDLCEQHTNCYEPQDEEYKEYTDYRKSLEEYENDLNKYQKETEGLKERLQNVITKSGAEKRVKDWISDGIDIISSDDSLGDFDFTEEWCSSRRFFITWNNKDDISSNLSDDIANGMYSECFEEMGRQKILDLKNYKDYKIPESDFPNKFADFFQDGYNLSSDIEEEK
jgi:hypothetical protein